MEILVFIFFLIDKNSINIFTKAVIIWKIILFSLFLIKKKIKIGKIFNLKNNDMIKHTSGIDLILKCFDIVWSSYSVFIFHNLQFPLYDHFKLDSSLQLH